MDKRHSQEESACLCGCEAQVGCACAQGDSLVLPDTSPRAGQEIPEALARRFPSLNIIVLELKFLVIALPFSYRLLIGR